VPWPWSCTSRGGSTSTIPLRYGATSSAVPMRSVSTKLQADNPTQLAALLAARRLRRQIARGVGLTRRAQTAASVCSS
jgi:hypothetical protein